MTGPARVVRTSEPARQRRRTVRVVPLHRRSGQAPPDADARSADQENSRPLARATVRRRGLRKGFVVALTLCGAAVAGFLL